MPGLFALRDEGAPTAGILAAVVTLLGRLTPEQLKAVRHPIELHCTAPMGERGSAL